MDRGAWQAKSMGSQKSRVRLDLVIKHNNNKVPGQEVAGRPEAPGEVKRRLLGQ